MPLPGMIADAAFLFLALPVALMADSYVFSGPPHKYPKGE